MQHNQRFLFITNILPCPTWHLHYPQCKLTTYSLVEHSGGFRAVHTKNDNFKYMVFKITLTQVDGGVHTTIITMTVATI